MNKTDREAQGRLIRLGIDPEDAYKLHLIERRLHRWHELECGDGNEYGSWAIERDDNGDGKPFMVYHYYPKGMPTETTKMPIRDTERAALKKLAAIMAKYPALVHYVQGDPRGGSLYIIRRDSIPAGATLDSCYSSIGVCV